MNPLPLKEVKPLLDKLPAKYQAIAAIGVTTGCRISEILNLRRFDILTPSGEIKKEISFLKLKSKKIEHRKLSIPVKYQGYITNHLIGEEKKGYDRPDDFIFRGKNGQPLSRLRVYHIFRQSLGAGFGTHWMRKTFAKEIFNYFLSQNKSDPMRALEITRQALGHARLDTTVRYLGITAKSICQAQNEIFNKEN